MPDLIYSRKASNEPLTMADLTKQAPAAFSTIPIDGVSDRYGHYTTLDAVAQLGGQGWLPVQAAQTQSRTVSAREHTKHLISFAREQDLDRKEGRPEIVLYNSSDRSSALKLYAGYFRYICSNSLVAGSGSEAKLVHSKGSIKNFEDLLTLTAKNMNTSENLIEEMRETHITYDKARYLAELGAELRWKNIRDAELISPYPHVYNTNVAPGSYYNGDTITSLLRRQRYHDVAIEPGSSNQYSLWEVFNRVQEGVMRSGTKILSATKKNPGLKLRKSRAIASVSDAIRVNRDCWDLFEVAA